VRRGPKKAVEDAVAGRVARCFTKIWQVFVQFIANFRQNSLTMAMLLGMMIFR